MQNCEFQIFYLCQLKPQTHQYFLFIVYVSAVKSMIVLIIKNVECKGVK